MEKTSGFGYHHHHHRHLMSANENLSGFPFDASHLSKDPVYRNPHYSFEDPTLRNIPLLPVNYGLQESSKASEQNVSQNRFYGAHQEKFHSSLTDFGQDRVLTAPTPAEKRFLIFDQSGDKTTLIYTHWSPKPPIDYSLIKEGPRYNNYPLGPYMSNDITEDNSKKVMEDEEMHEDTEELNALLCSDYDNDFSDDDEETSTGHSPSTMTDNGIPDLIEESGEEVDSSGWPTKRRKLSDACAALEDDEESNYLKNCKRSRKEKIHETVSILQSVIPGVNGKDAIVVLDEAIHYLRSLKVKAKALGLDAL